MSTHNKVVWSEGLFLQPQHFQQQDRYFERYVENRCRSLAPHSWGFTDVEIERDLLAVGTVAVRRADGVFPDGTPFRIPEDDPAPAPLEIGAQVRNQRVYLAIPHRRGDAPDLERGDGIEGLARHQVRESDVRNSAAASSDPAVLEVGALRTRLLLADAVTGAYACIPVADIVECRADRQVVLDPEFMPTVLHARAAERLTALLQEVMGRVHARAEELGGLVVATTRGGAGEIADFLMLQLLNRYGPLLTHFADSGRVHPETLYAIFAQLAGELATFTTSSRRPAPIEPYRHEDLRATYQPLMVALRAALTAVRERRAVPIPVEAKKFGIHVAVVAEPSLYEKSLFVLSVQSDISTEELRRRFPSQVKVGPVERIRDLVNLALPGVPVHPLPVAPRQIPLHARAVYFELEQSHELWTKMPTSGGIAMHVAGDFPGLVLELWAIRT